MYAQQIFSLSLKLGYLPILLKLSLEEQKFLILMKFYISVIFIFRIVLLELDLRNFCQPKVIKIFFCVFKIGSIILGFTFKLMTHFELNFLMQLQIDIHLFEYGYLIVPLPLVKKTTFSPLNCLCQKLLVSMWLSLFCLSGCSICLSTHQYHNALIRVSLAIRCYKPSNFIFFFFFLKFCFCFFQSMIFVFLESACQFLQKFCWVFYCGCIESIDQFKKNRHFNNISLLIHEQSKNLPFLGFL